MAKELCKLISLRVFERSCASPARRRHLQEGDTYKKAEARSEIGVSLEVRFASSVYALNFPHLRKRLVVFSSDMV